VQGAELFNKPVFEKTAKAAPQTAAGHKKRNEAK